LSWGKRTLSLATGPWGPGTPSVKFIGSLGIIGPRTLNRVASVTDILELGAFHNTSSVDVEARDDSFAKHGIFYDTCRAPVIKSEKVIK
jgi:hypothetical protein